MALIQQLQNCAFRNYKDHFYIFCAMLVCILYIFGYVWYSMLHDKLKIQWPVSEEVYLLRANTISWIVVFILAAQTFFHKFGKFEFK